METSLNKTIYELYPDRGSYVGFTCYPLATGGPLPENDDKGPLTDLLNGTIANNDPKALYIHIPFCESICTFCPFNRVLKEENKVERYLHALRAEIEIYSTFMYVKSSEFHAVYFGGGTPTCLSKEQLVDIVSFLKKKFNIRKDAEITIEGCTSNSDEAMLCLLAENGVNRLSFGVQTFNNAIRKLLNLQDDAAHVAQIIDGAHRWCSNIDIDLIYNLPGQTMEDWQSDLGRATDLGVESIMCHALELHPTKLSKQLQKGEVPPIGDGVLEIDMYINASEILERAGYIQWSLTHWMLPDTLFRYEREIRANNYDYLGLGLGSLSRINGFISRNIGIMSSYMDIALNSDLPVAVAVRLSRDDAMRSYVLRRLTGALSIKRQDFQGIFGQVPEDVFPGTIHSLEERGLIKVDDIEIRLTNLGIVWAGKICEEFCSRDFMDSYELSGWIQKHSIHNPSL